VLNDLPVGRGTGRFIAEGQKSQIKGLVVLFIMNINYKKSAFYLT
jgi:hypothetical protein